MHPLDYIMIISTNKAVESSGLMSFPFFLASESRLTIILVYEASPPQKLISLDCRLSENKTLEAVSLVGRHGASWWLVPGGG